MRELVFILPHYVWSSAKVMSSLAFARACHLQEEGSQHWSRCKHAVQHTGVPPSISTLPGASLQGGFMGRWCGEQLTRTACKTGVKQERGKKEQRENKMGFPSYTPKHPVPRLTEVVGEESHVPASSPTAAHTAAYWLRQVSAPATSKTRLQYLPST